MAGIRYADKVCMPFAQHAEWVMVFLTSNTCLIVHDRTSQLWGRIKDNVTTSGMIEYVYNTGKSIRSNICWIECVYCHWVEQIAFWNLRAKNCHKPIHHWPKCATVNGYTRHCRCWKLEQKKNKQLKKTHWANHHLKIPDEVSWPGISTYISLHRCCLTHRISPVVVLCTVNNCSKYLFSRHLFSGWILQSLVKMHHRIANGNRWVELSTVVVDQNHVPATMGHKE